MMRVKYLLIITVVLSAIIMFTGCQNEPTPVEQDSSLNQPSLSKFMLPAGATFVSATFNVYAKFVEAIGEPIYVHRITSDWQEMVVTWNSFYSTSPPLPYDETPEGFFNVAVGWNSLVVTNLVGSWLDGTNSNYGLLLDQQDYVEGKQRFNTLEKARFPSYLEITYLDGDDLTQIVTTTAIEDTYIYSDEDFDDKNYGGRVHMITGWTAEKQALVKFDFEPTPPEPDCETAYAYEDLPDGTCFSDLGLGFSNWGWSIALPNPLPPAYSETFDVYAAAGQCDITRGNLVGDVTVAWDGAEVTVTYNIDGAFNVEETHYYIGTTPVPKKKNGKWTVAPGQYPSEPFATNGNEQIYVIAHAVVCGNFE